MKLAQAILILLSSIFAAKNALAYPTFIGHGYTSCATCHYNPSGGGPLSDYGRAVSATTISAKPFWKTDSDSLDEDLASSSGFLGKTPLPPWLRLGADYRGMELLSGIGSSASSNRWIHMQAEASVTLLPIPDKIFGSVTLGFAPNPAANTVAGTRPQISLISREHYLAYRPAKWISIYGGMLAPAFGIQVPEHTAYLRSKTGLDKNDQSHGVLVHYVSKKWEAKAHLLAGNLFQTPSLRQKGLALTFEHDVAEKFRLGASVMNTENDFRANRNIAFHARLGTEDGSALLAQTGWTITDPISETPKTGYYFFVQPTARVFRGLYCALTVEYFTDAFLQGSTKSYRAGPSIIYFPLQRVEIRTDLQASKTTGGTSVEPEQYSLLTQFHLWL